MSDFTECECATWCRAFIDLNYITNHHPNCEHYNDSLIDVWRVVFEGQTCYSLEKPEDYGEGEVITQIKMHKEVFDNLPEFDGF
jgi:hypothetical protein